MQQEVGPRCRVGAHDRKLTVTRKNTDESPSYMYPEQERPRKMTKVRSTPAGRAQRRKRPTASSAGRGRGNTRLTDVSQVEGGLDSMPPAAASTRVGYETRSLEKRNNVELGWVDANADMDILAYICSKLQTGERAIIHATNKEDAARWGARLGHYYDGSGPEAAKTLEGWVRDGGVMVVAGGPALPADLPEVVLVVCCGAHNSMKLIDMFSRAGASGCSAAAYLVQSRSEATAGIGELARHGFLTGCRRRALKMYQNDDDESECRYTDKRCDWCTAPPSVPARPRQEGGTPCRNAPPVPERSLAPQTSRPGAGGRKGWPPKTEHEQPTGVWAQGGSRPEDRQANAPHPSAGRPNAAQSHGASTGREEPIELDLSKLYKKKDEFQCVRCMVDDGAPATHHFLSCPRLEQQTRQALVQKSSDVLALKISARDICYLCLLPHHRNGDQGMCRTNRVYRSELIAYLLMAYPAAWDKHTFELMGKERFWETRGLRSENYTTSIGNSRQPEDDFIGGSIPNGRSFLTDTTHWNLIQTKTSQQFGKQVRLVAITLMTLQTVLPPSKLAEGLKWYYSSGSRFRSGFNRVNLD